MRMQNGVMRRFVAAAAAVVCLASAAAGVEIVVSVDFENLPDVSASDTQSGQGAFAAPGNVWNSISPNEEPIHAEYGDYMVFYAVGKSNLLDSQGNVTGITVAAAISAAGQGFVDSWDGVYDPYDESAECTSHPALMNDLLIALNDPATVNISGLVPGGAYDLCLYGHSRETQGNTTFNVGGIEKSTSFATAPHSLTADIDYVVYNSVIADSKGKLSFRFIDNSTGYNNGGLNGFQIRGEAYTGPPLEEPAVSDINILSGLPASGSSMDKETPDKPWSPEYVTDGKVVVTGGEYADWVTDSSETAPRLAIWNVSSGFNKIRIWGAGDLDPDEVEIKSSTSLVTPASEEFAADLTDSYETVLLEMTSTAGHRITDGMAGDLPWQMYYWDYTVNVPDGTQSLFFDFGTSGRTRIVEVQAMMTTVLPGDANDDGMVDEDDAAILAAHWLKQGSSTWGQGDFNGDGNVNDVDAAMMATNWGVGTSSASVPEPSVLILLCSAIAILWIKRR